MGHHAAYAERIPVRGRGVLADLAAEQREHQIQRLPVLYVSRSVLLFNDSGSGVGIL